MVSGTNMVKIIVCIFTILFYAQKKQSLWHERHFLGMNDILFHRQHINNYVLFGRIYVLFGKIIYKFFYFGSII